MARALELRSMGWTFRAIAEATGVDVKTAFRDVADALADHRESYAETAADVRTVELARLDRLWRRAEEMLADGDADGAKAISAAIRIMERRARLLGLDEQGAEVTGAVVLTVEVPSPVKAGAD